MSSRAQVVNTRFFRGEKWLNTCWSNDGPGLSPPSHCFIAFMYMDPARGVHSPLSQLCILHNPPISTKLKNFALCFPAKFKDPPIDFLAELTVFYSAALFSP